MADIEYGDITHRYIDHIQRKYKPCRYCLVVACCGLAPSRCPEVREWMDNGGQEEDGYEK